MEKKYHYVFGPVPSRRLGRSLGVRVVPLKACSYNCIYCQLGRTNILTTERKEWLPSHEILREIIEVADRLGEKIDYITFLGDGEPTLHSKLGWLIEKTKTETGIKVAVLTNGSLLHVDEVAESLLEADLVSPKLDAGNERLFRIINRPHPSIKYNEMLNGLIEFRRKYRGFLWLEVMLINQLNDTIPHLRELAEKIQLIKPDNIFINTPIRPPAEEWVKPPTSDRILKAAQILGAKKTPITLPQPEFHIEAYSNPVEAIIDITRTHPMSLNEVKQTLMNYGYNPDEIIRRVLETGQVSRRQYMGKYYLVYRQPR